MSMKKFASRLRYFERNDQGNLTMITALAALPIMVAVGAAVDYGNATRDIAAFQNAADSAVLAVVTSDRAAISSLSANQKTARIAELEAYAKSYIEKNYKSYSANVTVQTPDIAIDGQKVTLTTTHEVPTSFLAGLGVVGPEVTITSEVKKAARPIELVMVMDTTGSMGTTYMAQAKTAAQNLLTKIYGGNSTSVTENENVRVALVPFSGAVRLNKTAYDYQASWIDTTGAANVSKLNFTNTSWHNYMAWTQLTNMPWNGCVEARWGSYRTDDTAPVNGNTLFTPYFAPDEPTFSGSTGGSYNYLNSYIGNTGTPNEETGLSSSVKSGTGNSNYLLRQNNQAKYTARSITAESSSEYGPWFNCAKSSIVPMTYKRQKVEDGINAMTSSGSTVIPEGLAWGWRVLSPTAPFTKVEAGPTQPASTLSPYNDVRWQKIMVLMTDGENDVLSNGNQINSLNGTWYSAYGRGKASSYNRFGTTTSSATTAALDNDMATICQNIKNNNIILYTVAFRVSSTSIQNKLKACATSDAHYSYAADGVALAAIFNHIGENVVNTSVYLSK